MGTLRITVDRKTLQEIGRTFTPNDKEPNWAALVDAYLPRLREHLDELREKEIGEEV